MSRLDQDQWTPDPTAGYRPPPGVEPHSHKTGDLTDYTASVGGVTDHGALTGLADDDHPQYATDTDLTNHVAAADPHPNYATDTDLSTHVAAADPHTGYLQESVISGLATPAITLGTAAAAGTTLTPIRSDSTIAAFDATVPVTQAFGDVAATGSVNFAARRDHKHGMPATPAGGGETDPIVWMGGF